MHQIDDIYGAPFEEGDTFVDYQTRMVIAAKEIARLAQEMVSILHVDNFREAPSPLCFLKHFL